jgi:N-acetyl-beta-hexosaminidase
MTPQESHQQCILDAVVRAHGILADYVEQAPRHCETTIARLFAVLDDQELIAAVNAINLESVNIRGAEIAREHKPSDRAG